jgi:hypothetical protein
MHIRCQITGTGGISSALAAGRLNKVFRLFDIVEERKRNAGGGVLAVRGNMDKQNAAVMRYMKPSFGINLSKYAWLSSMRIDHPVATPEEHSSSNLRV